MSPFSYVLLGLSCVGVWALLELLFHGWRSVSTKHRSYTLRCGGCEAVYRIRIKRLRGKLGETVLDLECYRDRSKLELI